MFKATLWLMLYQSLTWLALSFIRLCLPLLAPVAPKFAKWFRMRYKPTPLTGAPDLWIHAVSLGEVKIALALLEDHPHPNVLLTTATQAGYHFLIDKLGGDHVRYLPWDLPGCYARLFGDHPVPHLVVIETEIWPCLFQYVHHAGAKLVIVNGRLSTKTMRLSGNALFRRSLSQATHIAVRDEMDRERFQKFGVQPQHITVTGNIKFDFKPKSLDAPELKTWLTQDEHLLIMASIATDEIDLLTPEVNILLTAKPHLRILWAPRQLRDLEQHRQALAHHQPGLRSQLPQNQPDRILILDSFGELAACYGYARLALIGGSFNQRGGQNFLESLQAGTPALMGPSYENFRREVAEALDANIIRELPNPEAVAPTILELLENPTALDQMSQRAAQYLNRHGGAIARTTNVLLDLNIVEPLDS